MLLSICTPLKNNKSINKISDFLKLLHYLSEFNCCFASIPRKLCHFWWKACNNAISTAENLHSRNLLASPICKSCDSQIESIEHILFRCKKAQEIWKEFVDRLKIPCHSITSVSRWTNEVLLNLPQIFVLQLSTLVKSLLFLGKFGRDVINNRNFIFCDAAFVKESGSGALAFVHIKDGSIIGGNSKKIVASSAAVAESLAIREAAEYVSGLGDDDYTILSDCKSIVDVINSQANSKWNASAVLHDIAAFAKNSSIFFSFIRRCKNKLAHWIAKSFLDNSLPCNWTLDPPVDLQELFHSDFPETSAFHPNEENFF